jgi:hypothetical protein
MRYNRRWIAGVLESQCRLQYGRIMQQLAINVLQRRDPFFNIHAVRIKTAGLQNRIEDAEVRLSIRSG